MSLGPARRAIRAYIEANFTAAPLLWPNERHDDTASPAAFVAVETLGVPNSIRGIGTPGNRLFIHPGLIAAHVFVVYGTGQDAGDTLADALALLLTRKELPAPTLPQIVRTEDPTLYEGELASEDGNYWRVTVSVPFDFYYFG